MAETLGALTALERQLASTTPAALAMDGYNQHLWLTLESHHPQKRMPARVVTTSHWLAGRSGSADGIGSWRGSVRSSGVAVDSRGNVYVTDVYNNTIRKLTLSGTNWLVTTLGGMSGLPSTSMERAPHGLAILLAWQLIVRVVSMWPIFTSTLSAVRFPATVLVNPNFHQGQFSFNLIGRERQLVVIEASTDLMNWQRTAFNAIPRYFRF
ncbi:MAG: hypothetical protein U1G07_05810 [Verrucomicrobiota bacterium]